MNKFDVSTSSFGDWEEEIKVNATQLKTVKVETVKMRSYFKTGVKVSTENLFRGNIIGMPIIDVIVSDEFVELSGLVSSKVYSGLVLNLEYIDKNAQYLLEDFNIENSDVISNYIVGIYDFSLKRNPTEEEFNTWYFELQEAKNSTDIFLKSILYSEEFSKVNSDVNTFVDVLYKVIFDKEASDETFDYWVRTYKLKMELDGEKEARKYLIEKLFQYKEIQYLE